MKDKLLLVLSAILFFSAGISAQTTAPRASQKAGVMQRVGVTDIKISYSRPNVKSRTIWGDVVKYGEVWRTGADDATVFETSEKLMINGKELAAGRYSLYTIPNKDEWTIIFNRAAEQWGTQYDAKQDVLRVIAKPQANVEAVESLNISFQNVTRNTAEMVIAWEKVRVPVTIDAGDAVANFLNKTRAEAASWKNDDFRTPLAAANFIIAEKSKANYAEAMNWINQSVKIQENFGNLSAKARLLAETGEYKNAVSTGERAVKLGKEASPAANTGAFEKLLADWKTKIK